MFIFGLQAIVIPIVIIWVFRRNWSSFGFDIIKFRSIIHYGFIGTMLMMLLGLGFGFLKSHGMDQKGMIGSLILSFIAIIMIILFVIAIGVSKKERKTLTVYNFVSLISYLY